MRSCVHIRTHAQIEEKVQRKQHNCMCAWKRRLEGEREKEGMEILRSPDLGSSWKNRQGKTGDWVGNPRRGRLQKDRPMEIPQVT